jgi:hypothetical protein
MTNDEEIMAVDKRLARLEETVAKEFFAQKGRFDRVDAQLHAHTGRFDRLEDRMVALEAKVDIVAESIRGDIQTVLGAIGGLTSELRRTTASIREEHAADRRLTRNALLDHVTRIRTLEHDRHPRESGDTF